MVSVPARRAAVAYATGRGLSQRRACTLLSVARSALDYRSRKPAKDAPVLARMAELARAVSALRLPAHPRSSSAATVIAMSFGRAYRLWRAAGLQVPRKRPRKRIATGRPRPQAPTGANQVWSYDFVFDWCANGQQLKCLTVTDELTKEGLAIEVDGRIRSPRVIEVLSRLVSERGAPALPALRQRPGVRLAGAADVDRRRKGIGTALIDPGKPWQNGVDGELQRQVPRRVPEPRMVPLAGRGEGRHRERGAGTYNEVRPHSSLGYLTPAEFVARQRKTQRPVMRRAGPLRYVGPPRPGPLHQPPRKGQTGSKRG